MGAAAEGKGETIFDAPVVDANWTAAVEADHADAPDVSAAERVAADARANYEAALEAARRSLGGA